MANNQNLSPQGYNIGNNPYNENPFWEQETGEVAATVDVGTVRTQTIAEGLPASVEIENSGTPEQAVFDFKFSIPEGQRGLPGIQGERGPRGFTGSQGPQGPRGLTGSRGEKGETGEQGIQGVPGRDGVTPVINVSASILPIGGIPDVEVTSSGEPEAPNFKFTFSGLKGEKGEKGDGRFERKEVERPITGWYYDEDNIKYYNISIRDDNYYFIELPLSFNEFYNVNIVPYIENDNLYFLEINKIEDNYLKLDAIYTQTGNFPDSYNIIGWSGLDIQPIETQQTSQKILWVEDEPETYDYDQPYKEISIDKVNSFTNSYLTFNKQINCYIDVPNEGLVSIDITVTGHYINEMSMSESKIILDNLNGWQITGSPSRVYAFESKYINNDDEEESMSGGLSMYEDENRKEGPIRVEPTSSSATYTVKWLSMEVDAIGVESGDPYFIVPLDPNNSHLSIYGEIEYNGDTYSIQDCEFSGGGNIVSMQGGDETTQSHEENIYHLRTVSEN